MVVTVKRWVVVEALVLVGRHTGSDNGTCDDGRKALTLDMRMEVVAMLIVVVSSADMVLVEAADMAGVSTAGEAVQTVAVVGSRSVQPRQVLQRAADTFSRIHCCPQLEGLQRSLATGARRRLAGVLSDPAGEDLS